MLWKCKKQAFEEENEKVRVQVQVHEEEEERDKELVAQEGSSYRYPLVS